MRTFIRFNLSLPFVVENKQRKGGGRVCVCIKDEMKGMSASFENLVSFSAFVFFIYVGFL